MDANLKPMSRLKIFLLFLILFSCVSEKLYAQKSETFLRKIDFELAQVSRNEQENRFYLTLQFYKDINYKFSILNKQKAGFGNAIVEIYSEDRLLGTNYLNGKYFNTFLFQCSKTGMYDIVVRFINNKAGNSEISIYMVQ